MLYKSHSSLYIMKWYDIMNIIFSYNVKKTYAVENVINLYRNKYGIGYNTTVMNSSAEKKSIILHN